ncbi:anti-sigma factor [Corynebacterium falsenii]
MSDRMDFTDEQISKDDAQSWASLVALNAVDAEDQPTIDACRAAYPDFDRWVAEFADDAADLGLTAQAPAPPELRSAVLNAVAGDSSAQPAKSQPSGTQPGPPRRGFIIFSAAAVVILTLVISFVPLPFGKDNATEPPVAQAVTEQAEVAGGTVKLNYVPGGGTGTLTLNSVPAPAPGTAYQMWVRKGEEPAQSVGVMETEDVTPEMQAEVPDLRGAKEFMISLEPAGGSETPSSTTLVDFNLEG